MNRKSLRVRFCVVFVLTSLLLILVSCSGAEPATTEAKRPLRFAYILWPGYYPALIAQERGFFAEEGVEVEFFRPEQDSLEVIMAGLNEGKYDGVTSTLGVVVSWAVINPDIRVVIVSNESAG